MALWTRYLLVFWWPLVVGMGAVYGLRESRSRTAELLTTTPQPAWRRAALPAGAMALALASGFGLLILVGGVQVALGATTYLPLGWLPISLVAALALVAGAVFGMGVARAVPSVLTPPALTVFLLLTSLLLRQANDGALPWSIPPNRFALLSPATAEPREMLLTLSNSVHLGQTLWLLGLLATGLALLSAATRRARLLAVAPVLAGAALALLNLPGAPRDAYVVDKAAATVVCDGPVCVTQANRSRLPELAPRGTEALRVLHNTLGHPRKLSGNVVLIDFDDPLIAHATGTELTRLLVAQGLAPNCAPRTPWEGGGQVDIPAQSIAASWALGDHQLEPLQQPDTDARPQAARPQRASANAEVAWKKLTALPPAEQRSRIAQAHAAALSCKNALAALTGETSP
ncbi:hypothetical protein [Streptomyces sp. YGL11-2]|uniref:hypothetical protein n=1 Tax=Streptomyces sp. YGL11-2 TaxID=3414028 RepID=UPI003CF8F38E